MDLNLMEKPEVPPKWASLPPDELAPIVMAKWKEWREYYAESGLAEKAAKGQRYLYGMNWLNETSSQMNVGSKGGTVKAVINKIRQVMQRSLAMVSSRAPKMQPVAANSDADVRAETITARGIMEHVQREHDTETIDLEVLEIAMAMGEGFRLILWDANKGDPVAIDPDSDEPAGTAGDFANHALTPFDVARDPSFRSWNGLPWVIARVPQDKYELAHTYPEKADAILAASTGQELDPFEPMLVGSNRMNKGDAIWVYYFFHLSTRAVKEGRLLSCIDGGTWLENGALPYKGLPVARCSPGKVIGTSLGYANVFDALGVADLLNAMHSAFATNTVRWGVGTLLVPEGSNIQPSQLGNGIPAMKYDAKNGQAPTVLQTPRTPEEAYRHADMLSASIEASLGMNPTAMGNPAYSGMAASAMALLDQKASEFHDGLSRSWSSYKQQCANIELHALKSFADDPRVALIQGKTKAWMLKPFTSADLQGVDRIAMEAVPAGTGTLAWKFATMEQLARFGAQLKPEQVLDFMQTGQMPTQFEHDQNNVLRIQRENEMLMDGEKPEVYPVGTPWLDIREHQALLSNPAILEQPQVVTAIMETIQAKFEAWKAMDPLLVQLFGGPPPPGTLPPTEPMPVSGEAPEQPLGEPVEGDPGFAGVPTPLPPPQAPGGLQ